MCVFLFFSLFLVKYFQLCICIVTSLLPFVVNKAYQFSQGSQIQSHSVRSMANRAKPGTSWTNLSLFTLMDDNIAETINSEGKYTYAFYVKFNRFFSNKS